MKAPPARFAAALEPVLRDLERAAPGLLRLSQEPAENPRQAIAIVIYSGVGTGLTLDLSDPFQECVDVTKQIQDLALDDLGFALGSGGWPRCPRHSTGMPLYPVRNFTSVMWACPADGELVAKVGDLWV